MFSGQEVVFDGRTLLGTATSSHRTCLERRVSKLKKAGCARLRVMCPTSHSNGSFYAIQSLQAEMHRITLQDAGQHPHPSPDLGLTVPAGPRVSAPWPAINLHVLIMYSGISRLFPVFSKVVMNFP